MPKFLILSCSLSSSSHSRILAQEAARFLDSLGRQVRFIDLRDLMSSLPALGQEGCFENETVLFLAQNLAWAEGIILASPVYNWALSSVVKQVIELTGSDEIGRKVRAWEDKVITFLCAGGLPHSYLAYLPIANSLMADYKCLINPHIVYAVEADFDPEDRPDITLLKRLARVLRISTELTIALQSRTLLSQWCL